MVDKQYEIRLGMLLITYILAENKEQAKFRALKFLKEKLIINETEMF